MKKGPVIAFFVIVVLIQIAAPLSMIIKREDVLKHGVQFKFRVEPVDPFDAFRGRYVAIRIKNPKIPVGNRIGLKSGQKVYALIETNSDNFGEFFNIETVKPKNQAYMLVRIKYISNGQIYLDIPLDRYYMEESAAPKAERLYQRHARAGKKEPDVYVLVRIKDGFPVIKQLYVGGMRIEDAVKNLKN